MELIHPLLDETIPLLSLLHAFDGLFDLVNGLKVLSFGILNCILIAYKKEHLGKEQVGRLWDERYDIRNQLFYRFLGCE